MARRPLTWVALVITSACEGGGGGMPDGGTRTDAPFSVDAAPSVDGGADAASGARCGDGHVDTIEACDDGNTNGNDGCAADCAIEAGYSCNNTSPSACTAICGDGLVVGAEAAMGHCDDGNTGAGDGCASDCTVEHGFACTGAPSVCTAGCGDGTVAGSEACDDGNTYDGDGCSHACTAEPGFGCSGEPSTCTTSCGDGVAAGTEQCDDGNTTANDGCASDCTTETGYVCTGTAPSTCAPDCGDGMVLGGEVCDDGNVIDGDGCDSNCTPTACGNGVVTAPEHCDDGNTTSGDGCHADCVSETEIEPNEDGTPSTGGTGREGNDFDATAVSNADANGAIHDSFVMHAAITPAGDEDVFALTNDGTTPLVFLIETFTSTALDCPSADTVITLRDATGAELAQDDDSGPGFCSRISRTLAPGDRIYVHISEYGDDGTIASYLLYFSACDDGSRTGTEICDDGNAINGDGCDINCTVSACGNGVAGGTEQCDDGNLSSGDGCAPDCTLEGGYGCMGVPSTCTPVCGDGVLIGGEPCDDGNVLASDGCSPACAIESGWTCTGAPSTCTPICGDGQVVGAEPCDDGNGVNGDGCDNNCTPTGCGNGITTPPEQCDDGNPISGDGCEPDCTITLTCGDGILEGTEACDDGGRASGDGCSPTCTVEVGWTCTGMPSACATTCGDSIRAGAEQCDDGNLADGDGCDSTCTFTPNYEREPDDSIATATPITPGTPVNGAINPAGDHDYFTFTTTTLANVRVETFDGSGVTCTGVDTFVDLLRADGTTITSDDDSGVGFCSLIDPTVNAAARGLPPGTYYVHVRAYSATVVIPAYTLAVTVTPIVCGDGIWAPPEECDDGNVIDGDGCSSTCTVEYEVVAESEPNDDGTPQVATNDFQASVANGPYTRSSVIMASIMPAGDDDGFALVNTMGTARSVTLETTSGGVGLCPAGVDTLLYVVDDTGTVLASDDDGGVGACSLLSYTIPAGGVVFVRVIDYGDNDVIAAYELRVTFH